MTNQEAVADLETLLAYIPIYRRFYQSISMGIKALQSIEDIKAEIQNIYVGYRQGYEIMADVLAVFDKHCGGENE